MRGIAEGGLVAGERDELADADGVVGGGAGITGGGAARGERKAGKHAGQQGIARMVHGVAGSFTKSCDEGPSIEWPAAESSRCGEAVTDARPIPAGAGRWPCAAAG